jgi:hypothetical protein
VVDRWGGRLAGSILALSRTDRTLWIGENGLPDPYTNKIRGGLGRLDLDTGAFTLFSDELPVAQYEGFGPGPMATAAVVEDQGRELIVARGGLLVKENGAFTLHPLTKDGVTATPIGLAVDRSGQRQRIWLSTNLGLFQLDADTLETKLVVTLDKLGGAEMGHIAIDPAQGAVYGVVYQGSGVSTAVRVDGADIKSFSPGQNGSPEGLLTEVVFSTSLGAALYAAGSWEASTGGVVRWDGGQPTTLVNEGQLAEAARGKAGSFGAATLAIDEEDGVLLVGGNIKPVTANGVLGGGGLAWVELKTGKLAGLSVSKSTLPGDHVSALAYDPKTRRAHAVLRQPCDETKLGNLGLVSISFRSDGSARYERPVLSGVRSFSVSGGRAFVGVRDDAGGLSCDGYPIQTGLVELKQSHGGELVTLHNGIGPSDLRPYEGPVAVATSPGGALALGSWKDATLVGDPTNGFGFNPTDYGVSLYQHTMAWVSNEAVWLGGRASHSPGDTPNLADVGPRGAALLHVDASGAITDSVHFARASKDPKDVVGLPSGDVVEALVAADGSTYLVCSTEVVSAGSLDRDALEPFLLAGQPRPGGVAQVAPDNHVSVLAGPDAVPDPRAAALDESGAVVVLDASKGALRISGGKVEPFPLPLPAPAKARPLSLWIGKNGDLVASYDQGAIVSLGGHSVFLSNVGWVWKTAERAPGVLLLGTDEGLVRVTVAGGQPDVTEGALEAGVLPAFVKIDPVSGGGNCLKAGEACLGNVDGCCPGLTCGGSGFITMCQ